MYDFRSSLFSWYILSFHVISEKDPHFHGVYVLVVEADGLYIL